MEKYHAVIVCSTGCTLWLTGTKTLFGLFAIYVMITMTMFSQCHWGISGNVQSLIPPPWIKMANRDMPLDKKWWLWVMAEEVALSVGTDCVCPVRWLWWGRGDGRNSSCWLLEFQECVSHFLWVNLGDVYCYCGDEQPAPTQQSAVSWMRLMYLTILCWRRLFYTDAAQICFLLSHSRCLPCSHALWCHGHKCPRTRFRHPLILEH